MIILIDKNVMRRRLEHNIIHVEKYIRAEVNKNPFCEGQIQFCIGHELKNRSQLSINRRKIFFTRSLAWLFILTGEKEAEGNILVNACKLKPILAPNSKTECIILVHCKMRLSKAELLAIQSIPSLRIIYLSQNELAQNFSCTVLYVISCPIVLFG